MGNNAKKRRDAQRQRNRITNHLKRKYRKKWNKSSRVQRDAWVRSEIRKDNIGNNLKKKYGEYQWKKFGTKRQNSLINKEIQKRNAKQKQKQMERRRKQVATN